MSSSKDAALYGFQRQKRMRGDKEISSNTSQSFTSQLSSLINTPSTSSKPTRGSKAKKADIFTTSNRNTARRAKRDQEDSPAYATQKHTTNGETLDSAVWQRSKRKMEEKARIYAAMKRGDVEDMDEKYTVDFDRKWAEKYGSDADPADLSSNDDDEEENEIVEYTDEFGRTRTGTRAEAGLSARIQRGQEELNSDRFTARPLAPSNIIYGDTIQHQAFNPDAPIEQQMAELAKKRDRSLTPPPDQHFDANAEVRTKGTGFFQFSEDVEERKKQMEELEKQRLNTKRVRKAGVEKQAEEFFEELEAKMAGGRDGGWSESLLAERKDREELVNEDEDDDDEIGPSPPPASGSKFADSGVDAMDAMQRIEAALAREKDD